MKLEFKSQPSTNPRINEKTKAKLRKLDAVEGRMESSEGSTKQQFSLSLRKFSLRLRKFRKLSENAKFR